MIFNIVLYYINVLKFVEFFDVENIGWFYFFNFVNNFVINILFKVCMYLFFSINCKKCNYWIKGLYFFKIFIYILVNNFSEKYMYKFIFIKIEDEDIYFDIFWWIKYVI